MRSPPVRFTTSLVPSHFVRKRLSFVFGLWHSVSFAKQVGCNYAPSRLSLQSRSSDLCAVFSFVYHVMCCLEQACVLAQKINFVCKLWSSSKFSCALCACKAVAGASSRSPACLI